MSFLRIISLLFVLLVSDYLSLFIYLHQLSISLWGLGMLKVIRSMPSPVFTWSNSGNFRYLRDYFLTIHEFVIRNINASSFLLGELLLPFRFSVYSENWRICLFVRACGSLEPTAWFVLMYFMFSKVLLAECHKLYCDQRLTLVSWCWWYSIPFYTFNLTAHFFSWIVVCFMLMNCSLCFVLLR